MIAKTVFVVVGSEASVAVDTKAVKEPGWYILGENQESIGPYALSELRGKFLLSNLTSSFIRTFEHMSVSMHFSKSVID